MSDDDPPDEAYERVTNPERFAPLHDVVTRLVDLLYAEFDVERDDDPSLPPDVGVKTVTAVRLVPVAGGAPITQVRTTFPGVYFGFGDAASDLYPACGCDACHDVPQDLAAQLEADVIAVVRGGFTEYRNRKGRSGYRLEHLDAQGRSTGSRSSTPRGRLKAHHWPAWTPRQASSGTLSR